MKVSKVLLAQAALAGALVLAGAAIAQTEDAAPAAASGLDLPANVELFGKADPNVRKPTAIVNNTVITGTDVDQRVGMVLALNNVPDVQGDELQRLKLQILRQLIDESLEIQSARQQEISPKADEIDQSLNRVIAGFNRTPQEMNAYLRSKGSSLASLRRQIEGELAWSRVQRRKVEPFVNVSDEEVQAILTRLQASQGADEYHVREIFLSATTPEQQQQAGTNAQRIMEAIRKQEHPFGYYASNFSDATTRAVQGDLGWVRAAQLPDVLAANIADMQPGQLAGPIDVGGGYSIIFLEDKRKVLTADPRDAKLDLRQLTIDFAPGTTREQATAVASRFATEVKTIRGCGDVESIATRLQAKVVTSDQNRVRDLPPQLQDILLKMQVGEATPPFGSPDTGVRALVLCGRDDPRAASLPDARRLKEGLEQDRVNRVAARMLRDLRRDAVIEYK